MKKPDLKSFLRFAAVLIAAGVGIVCMVESGAENLYALGAFALLIFTGFLIEKFKIYRLP